MRAEYLFSLTHLCGISPNDPLKLSDFFQLIVDIDQYIEAREQANQG